jgi:hypothetical protein
MNREAASVVLEHARPTSVGGDLFRELARHDARFAQPSGSASTRSITSALGTKTG